MKTTLSVSFWALVALVTINISAEAQVFSTVIETESLPDYEVLSTLYVTTLGGTTRVSSSEGNDQFIFTMPTEFSLWTGPSGVATITDFKKQEWLPFMNGPIVASVGGHASLAFEDLEVFSGQSLILPSDPLSLRNFMLHVGDGESSLTFKVVKFDMVPETEHYVAFTGIGLAGFWAIRKRRQKRLLERV